MNGLKKMKIDDKIYNYEKTNEELDVDYTTAKRVAAALRQLYTTWTPLIDKADNPNDEENEYANYEIS